MKIAVLSESKKEFDNFARSLLAAAVVCGYENNIIQIGEMKFYCIAHPDDLRGLFFIDMIELRRANRNEYYKEMWAMACQRITK